MAQIITNQASLNFQYNGQSGTAVSNLATAVIDDPFTVDKIRSPRPIARARR
jgi:hypothetical protein